MYRDNLKFSDDAKAHLNELTASVGAFLQASADFIVNRYDADMEDDEVRALIRQSDAIGDRADAIRDAHLDRVRSASCDPLAGLVYSDMIVALRRIKNHTVNLIDARVGRWEECREALRNLERSAGESTRIPKV